MPSSTIIHTRLSHELFIKPTKLRMKKKDKEYSKKPTSCNDKCECFTLLYRYKKGWWRDCNKINNAHCPQFEPSLMPQQVELPRVILGFIERFSCHSLSSLAPSNSFFSISSLQFKLLDVFGSI